MLRFAFSIFAIFSLAGCGGGDDLPLQVSLSPKDLQLTQFQGKGRELLVQAEVTGDVPGPVVVVIQDGEGIVEGAFISGSGSPYYYAHIFTRDDVPLGTHRGTFQVHLCGELACSRRYGKATLAYSLKVVSETDTDLRALSPVAGISDWTSAHGDSSRTGFLPMTIDPKKFSNRWLWNSGASPDISIGISEAISKTSLGLTFVHKRASDGSFSLVALRESDGVEAWHVETPAASPPSLDGDRLFVAGSTLRASSLLAYDAATGSMLMDRKGPNAAGNNAGSPAISNGKVFVNFGGSGDTLARSGKILAFDASSGAYLWSSATGGYANVAPAADDDQIYFYRPNSSFTDRFPDGFTAIAANDGSTAFTVARPATGPGQDYYNGGTPVVDGAGGVVVSSGAQFGFVDRYDLAARTLLWSVYAEFATPVVSDDTVYVGTNGGLEARALADGMLRWSWRSDNYGVSAYSTRSIVATSNIVFVETDQEVAAVDVATHKTVWVYPQPGRLSLSASGLLYICRTTVIPGAIVWDGTIAAINLR